MDGVLRTLVQRALLALPSVLGATGNRAHASASHVRVGVQLPLGQCSVLRFRGRVKVAKGVGWNGYPAYWVYENTSQGTVPCAGSGPPRFRFLWRPVPLAAVGRYGAEALGPLLGP